MAVVIDNWSSWVLVRLRGDGMASQWYESEHAKYFRFTLRALKVRTWDAFLDRIEGGGDAGAMQAVFSMWLMDADGASRYLRVLSDAHEQTKSHSPAIECDTRIYNEKGCPAVEVEAGDNEIEDWGCSLSAVG